MLSTPLCTSELLLVWLCPLSGAWRPLLGAELLAVPEPVCVPARISRCQVEDLLLELLGVKVAANGLLGGLFDAARELLINGVPQRVEPGRASIAGPAVCQRPAS